MKKEISLSETSEEPENNSVPVRFGKKPEEKNLFYKIANAKEKIPSRQKAVEEARKRITAAKDSAIEKKGNFTEYVGRLCEELDIDPITKTEIVKLVATSGLQPEIALAKLAKDRAGDFAKIMARMTQDKLPVEQNRAKEVIEAAQKAAKNPAVQKFGMPLAKRFFGSKKKK